MPDLIYEEVKSIRTKRVSGKCVECSKRTQGRHKNEFCCRICKHEQIYEHTVETIENLSSFALGWLVGLIEGEGCFYCKDSKSNLKKGNFVYPMCGFALMSTDEDVMKKVSNILLIDLRGPYYKQKEHERKVVWSIQVTGNRAVAIMKTLYKHFSSRRKQQIDKALKWQARGRFEATD